MGGAMTTVKGGGWAHLCCVFWHEKPTFENILMVSVAHRGKGTGRQELLLAFVLFCATEC